MRIAETSADALQPFPQAETPPLYAERASGSAREPAADPLALYRELESCCGELGLHPVARLAGDLSDFESLGEAQWTLNKPSFLLYLKVRADVKSECALAEHTDGYF